MTARTRQLAALIGVNTFLPEDHGGDIVTEIDLARSTDGEKGQQIENVKRFQQLRNELFPPRAGKVGMGARRAATQAWPICKPPPANAATCSPA